jgi:hypothetical protein
VPGDSLRHMGFDERYLRPSGVVTASDDTPRAAFSVPHKGMDAVWLGRVWELPALVHERSGRP